MGKIWSWIVAAALGLVVLGQQPLPLAARDQPGLLACYGAVTFGHDNPEIRLMRVTTTSARLPFYQNRTEKTPFCPAEVDGCKLRSFVVPGDLLLVGRDLDGFACAAYVSPNVRRVNAQFRETIGFVPVTELRQITVATTSRENWAGDWFRSAEAQIKIEPDSGGKLKITGQATFGAHDPERVRRGAVNTGELDAVVDLPRQNMIGLGQGYDGSKPLGDDRSECRARLRLFGPYLVVEDNGGCGGNAVSFTGVYVRLKQH